MKSVLTSALLAALILIPTSASAQSSFASSVEIEINRLVNVERAKRDVPALKVDTALANIARTHSVDMAAKNYFSHTNLRGCTVVCRLAKAGYAWHTYGENIYMVWGSHLSAKEYAATIVQGWMASPGHKANILNKSFTVHGVGVSQEGTSIYATDDFALPR
jgi:uncharacterized protein YkwD